MNKKLKELIFNEIVREQMTVEQAVEYVWELKEEREKMGVDSFDEQQEKIKNETG